MDLIFASDFPIKRSIRSQISFRTMDDTRDSNIERSVDIGPEVRPVQTMTDYFLIKRVITLLDISAIFYLKFLRPESCRHSKTAGPPIRDRYLTLLARPDFITTVRFTL